jgi:circadian clock protein KaiC
MHLARFYKLVREFEPKVVIVDPITNLIATGNANEVRGMLGRMMDMFKAQGITAVFTSLTQGGDDLEQTEYGVSSFVDTWLLLRDFEFNGERNRLVHILKSRGTAHSNQVREFIITGSGIDLVDVYLGQEGILTGTARIAAEARARALEVARQQEEDGLKRQLEHKRLSIESQIESLKAELELQATEMQNLQSIAYEREAAVVSGVAAIRSSRSGKLEAAGRSSITTGTKTTGKQTKGGNT